MKYIIHRIRSNLQLMFMIFVVMGIFTYLSVDNTVFMISANILMGFSVLITLGYQYDKKSTDYVYSLPISKTKLFRYNQIAGYVILIIPILFWYSVLAILSDYTFGWFSYFAFIASVTYTYLIFSLITSLSHNHVDTIILMIFYYIVPFIGIKYSIRFLQSTVLGFPFLQQHADFLIRMTTFYINFDTSINLFHMVLYWIWYIVCVGVVLKFTYYFVKRRKVEYSGGNFPHPLIYTFIKGLVIWIYLIATNYSIHVGEIIRNNFSSILFGLILFIIFTAIQRRNIQIVISSAVKYMVVVVMFLSSLFVLDYVKTNYYENKMPSNVMEVELELENQGLRIYNRYTNENLIRFKEQENVDLIQKIHKKGIERKQKFYSLNDSLMISYQTGQMYPFMRRYEITSEMASDLKKVYRSLEFNKICDSLFEQEKNVQVYRQGSLKKEFVREFSSKHLKELILSRFLNLEYNLPNRFTNEYFIDIKDYRITVYFEIE